MDYDADGDLDILAGTYTGELYFYEGLGAGAFRQGQLVGEHRRLIKDPISVAINQSQHAMLRISQLNRRLVRVS